MPGFQQSDQTNHRPQPQLSGHGVAELGFRDSRGCIVVPPWVPQNYKELELLRQVYSGGVEHEVRKDVWPFLLGHYKFGMSKKEMEQVGREMGSQATGSREGASETSASSQPERNRAEEDVSRGPHCLHPEARP